MQTNDEPTPVTPERLLKLGLRFMESRALLSAIGLGVFTVLAERPGDLADVTARLGLHDRGARDFLDALVALGVLERNDGIYENSAEADLFFDRAKPSYMGGLLEMIDARLYSYWGSLTEALKTGQPQNESKTGADIFAELYADPVRLRSFLGAMSALSTRAANAITERFDFSEREVIMDIGCAAGALPVAVARQHPHLRGGGFDLPVVREVFEEHVAQAGLGDRLTFFGGDFFADPLPPADVLVFGHILHDWDLDEKRFLLGKAYEALPGGGAVIVYDAIIDDERRTNTFGLLASLNMLIETPGGFDYTGADCRGWMEEVGFREIRVEHLVGHDSMVVGIR